MSRRTFPRSAAALLLVLAAANAAPAQSVAPMPREKAAKPAVEVELTWNFTQPPAARADNRDVFNFYIGLFGQSDPQPRRAEAAPCPAPVVERVAVERVVRLVSGPVAAPLPAPPAVVASTRTAPACPTAPCLPAPRGDVMTWVVPLPLQMPAARPCPADLRTEVVEVRTLPPVVGSEPTPAPPMPVPVPPLGYRDLRAVAVPPPVAYRTVTVVPPAPACRTAGTWYRELPGCVAAFTLSGDELHLTLTLNADGVTATVTITADCATTKDGTVHGVVTGADLEVTAGQVNGMDIVSAAFGVQALVDQPFAFRLKPTDGGLMLSNLRVAGLGLPGGDGPNELLLLTGKYKSAAYGTVPTPKPAKDLKRPLCVLPADLYPDAVGGMTLPNPKYLEHFPQYFPPDPAFPLPRELAAQQDPEGAAARAGLPGAVPAPCPACPACPPCTAPMPRCAPPVPVTMMVPGLPYPLTTMVPPVVVPPPPPPPMPPLQSMSTVPPLPIGTWCREAGPVAYTLTLKDGHLTITALAASEANGRPAACGLVLTADCYSTRDGCGLVGIVTSVDVAPEGKAGDPDADALLRDLPKIQKELTDKPFALNLRLYDGTLVIGNVRFSTENRDLIEPLDGIAGRYRPAGEKGPARPSPVRSSPRPVPAPPAPVAEPPLGVYVPPGLPGQPVAGPVYGSTAFPPGYVSPLLPPNDPPVVAPTPRQVPPPAADPKPGKKKKKKADEPTHLTPERIHGGIVGIAVPAK